jgi:hypothetical protein
MSARGQYKTGFQRFISNVSTHTSGIPKENIKNSSTQQNMYSGRWNTNRYANLFSTNLNQNYDKRVFTKPIISKPIQSYQSQDQNAPAHLILKNLWLGNLDAAQDRDFLTKNGIRLVINCTNDLPNYHENDKNINYIRIPVDDSLLKKDFMIMTEYLFRIIPYLDEMLKSNVPVLIHCYAGMQRSACVVAAYLIKNKVPLYKAIHFIQKKRNIAFTPQINFIDSLLLFAVNHM